MSDVIYTFQGKDITMNVCIQIRAVVDILQENLKITFEEAMLRFYCSKTYRILQETEKAPSPGHGTARPYIPPPLFHCCSFSAPAFSSYQFPRISPV